MGIGGPGATSPFVIPLCASVCQLRAERRGSHSGRVVLVRCACYGLGSILSYETRIAPTGSGDKRRAVSTAVIRSMTFDWPSARRRQEFRDGSEHGKNQREKYEIRERLVRYLTALAADAAMS